MSREFFSHLPHKSGHQSDITDKRAIAEKQDLCQVSCGVGEMGRVGRGQQYVHVYTGLCNLLISIA